jgi:hypothetical protein
VRDICEPAKDIDAEDAKGSDSSQYKKETEDGGNARTDVPDERSALEGGGASPSIRSGTPDADISTAIAPSAGGSASALPLKLALKTLKFYQIPGMSGAVVTYTQFALVCYLNKFYFGLLSY